MGLFKSGGRLLGLFILAIVLGGLLAGVADAVAMEAISGTPLGPRADASPIAWTLIGGVAIYGFNEVRD